ncbi:D-amino acid dehydrogenase [Sinimarinibacterium sp. NLF-5-8]|uniref:D-amino acid dehydrogenase n=1 Tax=Sinimarinibacterium sp. NLF-5-8 TaxID=2698684 RepID=UPI00137C1494|nr:D-amino acid dehydrogenase [Sinimarinibacterium sp. NLF-5-8]QHS09209.1 FAD-dependent oxidoreductase [Sinimarinibacterium sp. NLF-5-8]
MNIIVLGAGVIGVTSAWYLHQAGHHVTVVERNLEAASETSFANGGQISVCHSQPWAQPGALPALIKSLRTPLAPLRWRAHSDADFWQWCARFAQQCTRAHSQQNMARLIELGLHSRTELQHLRAQLKLDYQQRSCGILHLYSQRQSLQAGRAAAEQMTALGCPRRALSRNELIALEPALIHAPNLLGGTFTPDDESGDARAFTRALAAELHRRGVVFHYGHTVTALRARGNKIQHIEARNAHGQPQQWQPDAVVIAAGCASPALVRPLGLRLWIQPAKGYSLTVPVKASTLGYQRSLIDDEAKLVFSRFGDHLRIAGTGELCGFDLSLDPRRCEQLRARLRYWFGDIADDSAAQAWCGLRPATPSNVPYLGASAYANLWLNCGHGTLGWTLACGSAQVLSDLINGKRAQVSWVQ